MSNKPSIIFNPDFNRLVLDPLTNRLITVGELSRRTAPPAPVFHKQAAAVPDLPAFTKPVSTKTILTKQAAATSAATKPFSIKTILTKNLTKPVVAAPAVTKPVVPASAVTKPVVPASAVTKPVVAAPAVTKPVSMKTNAKKSVAKEVQFDISAWVNDIPVSRPVNNKGPLIIPTKGGYGAVILGRGRR
jgi:hypothetical protein